MPRGVWRLGVAPVVLLAALAMQVPDAFAQPEPRRRTRPAANDEVAFSAAMFGGNVTLGQGASMSVIDVVDGTSGTSQTFASRFAGGVRMDGEDADSFWRLAFDLSTAWINSPVTLSRGPIAEQRTISFLETDFAVLLLFQLPGRRMVQPYGGAGPAGFITHTDSQGGAAITFGVRWVAGARVWFKRRVYGLVEARFGHFGDRRYRFDEMGVQDAQYATMSATIHGSPRTVVIGVGFRFH